MPTGTAPEGAAITVTVAEYPSRGAALTAYNGWFANHGFMAAAERRTLGLGDRAERFDVGWPPLHAVIALEANRFVLAEADSTADDWDGGPALEEAASAGLDLALEDG